MKCSEFIRLAERNGWTRVRQTGSHIIFAKGKRTYPIPYHGSKEIGKGLEKKARKEMGLR